MKYFARLQKFVLRVDAHNIDKKTEKINEKNVDDFLLIIYIFIKAKIMKTRNMWIKKNLVNDVMKIVHSIFWNDVVKNSYESLFVVIMINVDEYNDIDCFNINDQKLMFIFLVTCTFEIDKIICHRTQFSLRLVAIIIVHKNQDLTLSQVVIFLFSKVINNIIIYVICFRVRIVDDFVIKQSFFHDAFSKQIFFKVLMRLNDSFRRMNRLDLIRFINVTKIKTIEKIEKIEKKKIKKRVEKQ